MMNRIKKMISLKIVEIIVDNQLINDNMNEEEDNFKSINENKVIIKKG